MSKYLLFAWERYEESGGFNDFQGIFYNVTDAKDSIGLFDVWQIVDQADMTVVEEGYNDL